MKIADAHVGAPSPFPGDDERWVRVFHSGQVWAATPGNVTCCEMWVIDESR